jgi:outer membrane protein assembly factor BamD (BamD/ComL family)
VSANKHSWDGRDGCEKKEMKFGAINQLVLFVMTVALVSSGSCSLFRTHGPAAPFREDFSLLDPKDFPEKIKQLEDISQHDKSLSVRTRALFYIALAHMHYKNPSPDYSQAAQYLDKYIALEPNRKDIDEIVAWRSVVQTLDSSLQEYKKLERSYAQLKQQFDRANKNRELLLKEMENQKKEIARLKQTIKELDTVQQEIEKKRKGIKK